MKKSVYIYVAGLVIEMNCRHYMYIKQKCEAFLLYATPAHIDIRIEISDDELNDRGEMPGGFIEPECNREFYKLHKKLRIALLHFNCAIIHGVALNVDGRGIVFTASSGVGKSVQADLWKDTLFERVTIINDDWPIIRLFNNRAYVSSSPWCGHRNLFNKEEIPLNYILFVERSDTSYIVPVDEDQILTELIKRTTMLYYDLSKHLTLYSFLESIIPVIGFRRAGINLSRESVYKILSNI